MKLIANIASLILQCVLCFRNLKNGDASISGLNVTRMDLCEEVLRYNRDAFECTLPGKLGFGCQLLEITI